MAEMKLSPMSDVAKPGTTPPPATSRPVVNAPSKPAEDTTVRPEAMKGGGSMQPRVTPSSTAEQLNKASAADTDKAMADKKTSTAEKDLADERQARLQEIIESGEYNVPIHQENGSKSAMTFILTALAVFAVGAAALYVLSALKVIDLGLKI